MRQTIIMGFPVVKGAITAMPEDAWHRTKCGSSMHTSRFRKPQTHMHGQKRRFSHRLTKTPVLKKFV